MQWYFITLHPSIYALSILLVNQGCREAGASITGLGIYSSKSKKNILNACLKCTQLT